MVAGWRQAALPPAAVVLAGLVAVAVHHPDGFGPVRAAIAPGYAGSSSCASCHQAETAAWSRSHHAQAMQPARADTILGHFDGAWHQDRGASVRFVHTGDAYTAQIAGTTYPVRATFGVFPLQQYLAETGGGRLQVLPLAWDTRPRESGGQRWFNPARPNGAAWNSRDQTWNFMCADCHATGVARGYDLAHDSYATSMSQAGVTCESCHGPGAAHVAWAREGADRSTGPKLTVVFARGQGNWSDYDPKTGIRHWQGAPRSGQELDICAPCHSRRRPLVATPRTGAPFLDGYDPELLSPALYQADGQFADEVFEWGSFLQSRMHQAGVTCSDCHDVHGLTRHADGNALCAQCHAPKIFDTAAHSHHHPGSAGAVCTACHMPSRLYMGVHVRHDHGFRVPRPDLDEANGTSDACTSCHGGRTASWAASAIEDWVGHKLKAGNAQAVFAASRTEKQASRQAARDPALPDIMRATALSSLGADAADAPVLLDAAQHGTALDRFGVAHAEGPAARDALAALLHDPLRAVRVNAARPLAGEAGAALDDWVEAERVAADRPESHVNLGGLLSETGALDQADTELQTALRLAPDFAPALIDLGDLSRMRGDEAAAETYLRRAVAAAPGDATAWYALGLSLVRQKRNGEAMQALDQARTLEARPQK
jgi:Flp pilus assembly protein TadD